ncbi:hypothetical protein [Calothrix sp. NIES-2098]
MFQFQFVTSLKPMHDRTLGKISPLKSSGHFLEARIVQVLIDLLHE